MNSNYLRIISHFKILFVVYLIATSLEFALSHDTNLSSEPSIRVKIASSQNQISLSGKKLKKEILLKNLESTNLNNLKFNCISQDKKHPIVKSPLIFATITSSDGVLSFRDKKFWGSLSVVVREENKGCDVVNNLSFEKYINQVIAKEMNANWPLEALKAQAVAARSYALYKKNTNFISKKVGHEVFYDVENSEQYQVNGTIEDTTIETLRAVNETRGEVLKLAHRSELTPVFYHSKCGGKTMTPGQVWNHEIEGYESVTCPFCYQHGVSEWTKEFSKDEILNVLKDINYKESKVQIKKNSFRILSDSKTKSKLNFYQNNQLFGVQKSTLRQNLGLKKILSNYFHIEEKKSSITVHGKGFGHGVGMCQFGAMELAKRGYNYKQILSHYYPNHHIKKVY